MNLLAILPNYVTWDPPLGIPLGFFTLRFYSLMFVFAFAIGWVIMNYIYDKEGENKENLESLFFYTFLATIIGARLGHVIFYQPELFKDDFFNIFLPFRFNPTFEFTGFQGLASHGAAIALCLSTFIFSLKILKKNPLWLFDRLCITIALAGFFIRMGNFFNSEIVGKPSDASWAIKFIQQSDEYGDIVPRYPTQLFEAFSYLLLFGFLWLVYQKTDKKQYMGYIFGLFMAVLWSIRFLIEYLKEPQGLHEKVILPGLNTGQVLSIPLIIVGLICIFTAKYRKITT